MKVEKVIARAQAFNGYLEKETKENLTEFIKNAGDENFTYFAEVYDKIMKTKLQGLPWCAMFVSYVFYSASGKDLSAAKKALWGNLFAACQVGVNMARRVNRFYSKPEKGDVIFFTNGKRAYHTGIVIDVDDTYVYTIEGNTSADPGVVENGGGVNDKKYKLNYSKILGYGRPFYK